MAANQQHLNLRVVQQIPEQLPQTIAVKVAEDRNGAAGRVQVRPGLSEALADIIHPGPQGHHPDDPVRIDDGEAIPEMERLKFESGCHAAIILQLPAKGKGDYREFDEPFSGAGTTGQKAKGKRQKKGKGLKVQKFLLLIFNFLLAEGGCPALNFRRGL